MAKELYTVTIESEVIVYAENKKEAINIVNTNINMGNIDITYEDMSADKMSSLGQGWELDYVPYGKFDEWSEPPTIKKLIELGAAPRYTQELKRYQDFIKKLP